MKGYEIFFRFRGIHTAVRTDKIPPTAAVAKAKSKNPDNTCIVHNSSSNKHYNKYAETVKGVKEKERGEKMANETLRENVKRIMKEKGIKQKKVAELIGMTQMQYSDLMCGRKTFTAEYVPLIAKALEVTPNDLFTER